MLVLLTVRIQKVNSQLNQHLPVIRQLDDTACHTRNKGRCVSIAILHPSRCQRQKMARRTVAQFTFDCRSEFGRTVMPGHSCIQMQ